MPHSSRSFRDEWDSHRPPGIPLYLSLVILRVADHSTIVICDAEDLLFVSPNLSSSATPQISRVVPNSPFARHTYTIRNNPRKAGLNRSKQAEPFTESHRCRYRPALSRSSPRVAAVAVFAGAATLGLQAQQAAPAAPSIFNVAPQTTQSLIAANDAPLAIGYSTSAGAEETADDG